MYTVKFTSYELHGTSNYRQSHCFFKRLYRRTLKKNFKVPLHWPLWGESTGDRWIPLTKGQWRRKCFHLMTSSCSSWYFCFVVGLSVNFTLPIFGTVTSLTLGKSVLVKQIWKVRKNMNPLKFTIKPKLNKAHETNNAFVSYGMQRGFKPHRGWFPRTDIIR